MSERLVFTDPPKRRGRPRSLTNEIVASLRARRGEWAIFTERTTPGAARSVARRVSAYAPDDIEVRTSMSTVYVRAREEAGE